MQIRNNSKIRLKQYSSQEINSIAIRANNMSPQQKEKMRKVVNEHPDLFIKSGEFRNSDTPVYSKQ